MTEQIDKPSARDWIMDLASRISAGHAPEWCDEMRKHMDDHQAEVLRDAAGTPGAADQALVNYAAGHRTVTADGLVPYLAAVRTEAAAEAIAQRDLARDTAVALEQDCTRLGAEVEQLTTVSRLFLNSRQEMAEERFAWQERGDRAEVRVAELERERAKYVGAVPTIAEEMAYLNRCIDSVLELCDKAEQQAGRWEQPLPAPEWAAEVRKAAEGLADRLSYPPILPWAQLMDSEDLQDFLGDLIDALNSDQPTTLDVLAEVEKTCASRRAIAEVQHAHNTAPGPDAAGGKNR